MKGKTVIYCAHRLASIKNVERIHVLKEGRVQECGSHNELFNKPDSIYRSMWNDYLQESNFAKNILEQVNVIP